MKRFGSHIAYHLRFEVQIETRNMNHRSVQIVRRGNNTVVFSVGDRIDLSLTKLQEAGLWVSNNFSKSIDSADTYVRGLIIGFDEEYGMFSWSSVLSFVFALDLPLKNRQITPKEITWAQDFHLNMWQVFIIPQRVVATPRLMRKASYNVFEPNCLFICQVHGCGIVRQRQDTLKLTSDLGTEVFHCCKAHSIPWNDQQHTVETRYTRVLFAKIQEASSQMQLLVDNMEIKCLFYTNRYLKSSPEMRTNILQEILFAGPMATVCFEIEAHQRRSFHFSWLDLANQVFTNNEQPLNFSTAVEGQQEALTHTPTIIDGYVDDSSLMLGLPVVMDEDGDAEEVKFSSNCVVFFRSAAANNASNNHNEEASPIQISAGTSFHTLSLAALITVPERWHWKLDDLVFFVEGNMPFPYGNRELHYRMPLTSRSFHEAKDENMCRYSRSVRDLTDELVTLDMHSIQDAVLPPVQLDCLSGEFRHNPSMVQKVQVMETVYGGYRKVRGDGNCYYRAVIFGVLEQALQEPFRHDKLAALHKRFLSSCSCHSEDIKFFLDRLEAAASGAIWQQATDFEHEFCDPESRLDLGMVMSTKELLGQYIIQHQDDLIQGMTLRDAIMAIFSDMNSLEEYVQEYVVKLDVSAEGPFVFLGLLYKALQCHGITIMLDRRAEVPLNLVETDPFEGLAEAATEQKAEQQEEEQGGEKQGLKVIASVHLLLRPGHYDLLYPLQSCAGLLQPKIAGAMLESVFGIERQAMVAAQQQKQQLQQEQQQQHLSSKEKLSTASAAAEAVTTLEMVEEENPFANQQDRQSLDHMKNVFASHDAFISPENTFMLVDMPSSSTTTNQAAEQSKQIEQQQQQGYEVDHSDIAVVIMMDSIDNDRQPSKAVQQQVVTKSRNYEFVTDKDLALLRQQSSQQKQEDHPMEVDTQDDEVKAQKVVIEDYVPPNGNVPNNRVILVSGLPTATHNTGNGSNKAILRTVLINQDQSLHQVLTSACADPTVLKKFFAHCSYACYDRDNCLADLQAHVHSLFHLPTHSKIELLDVQSMRFLPPELQLDEDNVIEVLLPNMVAIEVSVPISLFSPKINNDAVQVAPASRKKAMSYSSASASAAMDIDDDDTTEQEEPMQRYLIHIDMTQVKSIDHLTDLISQDVKIKQPTKLVVARTSNQSSFTLAELSANNRLSLYQGHTAGCYQLVAKEQYLTLTVMFFHEQQTVQVKERSSLSEIMQGLGQVFHIPMPGYPLKLFYGEQPITDDQDKELLLPIAACSKQVLTLTSCVMCFRDSFCRPEQSANYRQELLSVTDTGDHACEHLICRDCLEIYLSKQPKSLYKVPVNNDAAGRMMDAIPEAVPIKAPCCSEYCYLSSNTIAITDKASADFTIIANEMHEMEKEHATRQICRLNQLICFEDHPDDLANMYQLGCGHFFHVECIGLQMKHLLDNSHQERQDIRCIYCVAIANTCICPTCFTLSSFDGDLDLTGDINPHRVTYEEMKYLLPKVSLFVSNEEKREKYLDLFQKNMLQGSGMMVSVIECRCGCIFEAPGHTEGECPKCKFNMCFNCKLAVHPGLACGEVPEVTEKGCQYPQRCPGCEQIYEYWRDCLHMTCVKVDCKQQFCFLCAAPHSPSLYHGPSYHRPKCDLYTECCAKKCIENGREFCETDKYWPGPCTACKGKANMHNLCTHSEWRPCSTCRAGNTLCSHWCNECEAAGGKLCTRPTNMRRLKGEEVEARFYAKQLMDELDKEATAKDKKAGGGNAKEGDHK